MPPTEATAEEEAVRGQKLRKQLPAAQVPWGEAAAPAASGSTWQGAKDLFSHLVAVSLSDSLCQCDATCYHFPFLQTRAITPTRPECLFWLKDSVLMFWCQILLFCFIRPDRPETSDRKVCLGPELFWPTCDMFSADYLLPVS